MINWIHGTVSIFLSKYVFSHSILQLSLKTLHCYQIELSNVMTCKITSVQSLESKHTKVRAAG